MKIRAKVEFSVAEGDFEQTFDIVMTDNILPERPLGMALLFVDLAQTRMCDVIVEKMKALFPDKEMFTVADVLYPYLEDVSQETKENDEVIS